MSATLTTGQSTEKLPRARARFLAQAIQLEEEEVSDIVKAAIYFSLFLFIAIITWAALTSVNEVTVAKGEAVPDGYIYNIQHLEGGIVSEIAVRNGDPVQPGDLLIRFALPVSKADYEQLQIRKATLVLNLERLTAIEEDRKPNFGNIGKQFPDLAAKEMASYYAQIASTNSELNVLKTQTSQRKSELLQQKNQVKALEKEIGLLQKQVDMRETLAAKHIVSQTDLLNTKSQLASRESQLKSIQDGISVASMALQEAINHRHEIIANHKKEAEFEATEVAGQLAEVEKSLVKAQDRVKRLDLYAPISGIIKGIAVTSINAVVQPGEVIMQIVPVKDDLIVEARILPEEIGHIHIGQPAEVKVNSYDASKYGHVNGEVKQISASTYLDEKMNPYYRARIELEKNYVGADPQQMKIIPGMTVQINIITGVKSILDYLLKPVTRGFRNAFQER
jgi:membrane fusion protein, adhesin transport system